MTAAIPNVVNTDDDREMLAVAARNLEWKFEVSSARFILVSPLSGTATGAKEGEAFLQLVAFARSGAGGRAFPSSTGFRLPDGSLRGPGAARISPTRLAALSEDACEAAFWRVCPDVIIEVKSESDRWSDVIGKLDDYHCNGASFTVALDPERRIVETRGSPPATFALDYEAIFDA